LASRNASFHEGVFAGALLAYTDADGHIKLIDGHMHNQIPVWHYANVTEEELELLNVLLDKLRG
jgi:hypothetical protein